MKREFTILLFLAIGLVINLPTKDACAGETKKKIVSLAIVSHKEGDAAVDKVQKVVKGIDHVQIVIAPKSKKQMFDYFAKLKKKGVEIDHLIIGGHGGDGSINLEKFELYTEDVNLENAEYKANAYKEVVERRKRENAGQYDIDKAQSDQKEWQDKVDQIKGAQGVMAENGVIQVLTCRVIASEKGKEFAEDLGEALFGDKKGNIVASKTDVDVYEQDFLHILSDSVYDAIQNPFGLRDIYYYFTNQEKINKNPGDFYAEGDWETISINGGSILYDGTYFSEHGGGTLPGGGSLLNDSMSSTDSKPSKNDKIPQTCPADTVKLSDQNDQVECVPCSELYGDFNAALSGGDRAYAETLADLGVTCGWSETAQNALKEPQSCPENTVKLSDQNDQVECVPCATLYGDFSAALSGGDRAYAETLADLGATCGWSETAQNALKEPQSCPENTVKLSDQNDQVECVPCATLYGDYTAAVSQGDHGYADSLTDLAGICGWAQSVAEQNFFASQQAELDQRCKEQAPGSYAVINGDRYTCQCPAGMLALTGPGGTSCQSCEQVRGYINTALQGNDLNTVKGLMAGAQSCGWYDQAVQVVAGIEQNRQNQKRQQSWDAHNAWSMNMMNNMLNQMNSGGSDDIPLEYYQKKNQKTQNTQPPTQAYNPPKKKKTKKKKTKKKKTKIKDPPTKTTKKYTKPPQKKKTKTKKKTPSSNTCPPGTIRAEWGGCIGVAVGEDRSGTVR